MLFGFICFCCCCCRKSPVAAVCDRRTALIEGVKNCQDRVFPSWNRRGGCAIKKKARSLRSGADGVVIMVNVRVVTLSGTDHPVCAFIRRLRSIFLSGAATPPLRGGEHPPLQFIHTFIERHYSNGEDLNGFELSC